MVNTTKKKCKSMQKLQKAPKRCKRYKALVPTTSARCRKLNNAYAKNFCWIFDENLSQWTHPPLTKEETWPPLLMYPPSRKKKHGPGH